MNMRLWCVLLILLLVSAGSAAWGQDSDDPPEILSSELALKTVLESDRLEVTFVIVDTDKVTEVAIDGEIQSITPGDTVQITKSFVFTKDVTKVEVSATDEAGHNRTVTYTVFRPGVDPTAVAETAEAPRTKFTGTYDVRFESDSNPSNDLSLPFGITLPDVPDLGTNQPADTRTYLLLTGTVSRGAWTGYGGVWNVGYSDAIYADTFDVLALFVGGYRDFKLGEGSTFRMGYMFMDLDVGGSNYSYSHLLSPAYITKGDDGEGGVETTTWGLDLALKDFADDTQGSATDLRLRYDVLRVRANKLDRRRRVMALGVSSEGIPDTDYQYLSIDYDWRNRWESGLLWDFGWGIAFRNYPNDVGLITDTRLDFPLRVSTGVGWRFSQKFRVMGNLNFLQNLSTGAPFTRVIVGVGVNGTF